MAYFLVRKNLKNFNNLNYWIKYDIIEFNKTLNMLNDKIRIDTARLGPHYTL